ncbi:MAG TPA: 2-succinyl-5-enolpyruvyl-6-hydroxy-3-cyclohexene-1-carboxylic-acid synthase [Acidimicrobiales bacterium]|nr:2-succinyl-5-enolpyruvyl-6-hydroxy-3-cyclohexene-1-carboxylic-acid synthase [Acidimicrobiales bacterium]
MSRSVPSASEVQATYAATLFDEWIARGLRNVVLAPGSRSTPLALAAASRRELTVHVRLDERSAGFYALGRALATLRPVVMMTTSGTAAAELHACVAEADLAFIPLIVITADRPPELHGVGAPQTMEQAHLYGHMVRRFDDVYDVSIDAASRWRGEANGLWDAATGEVTSPGPVHLNVGFAEPLMADALALPERRELATRVPRHVDGLDVTALDLSGLSVLCVVGRGVTPEMIRAATALQWVVLGDATARNSLAYFDPLLRSDDFARRARPDVVIRLGGVPASKILGERLREWKVRTIALSGAGFVADPDRLVSDVYVGEPSTDVASLSARTDYVALWRDASASVGRWLEGLDAQDSELTEPLVARTVVAAANDAEIPLIVGSSMPVRDVEWWAPARRSLVVANRGVNGIDGVVSTALGVSAGGRGIALVGDLTMLHDVSGLVDGLGSAGGACVLVVADNQGGGIFSFLPQATALSEERFELLFGTPRRHELDVIAEAFGHVATKVSRAGELRRAIDKGLDSEGLTVVIARVPTRPENVDVHERWNDHVRTLVVTAP